MRFALAVLRNFALASLGCVSTRVRHRCLFTTLSETLSMNLPFATARPIIVSLPLLPSVLFALPVAAFLVLVVSSCGASYQSLYEGEVLFEHCYRLDENPHVPQRQRLQCWRNWSREHGHSQPRDRVEYALQRQRELTPYSPSTQDVSADSQPTELANAPVRAPEPTSAFTAPPSLHTNQQTDTKPSRSLASVPPAQSCVQTCQTGWDTCAKACGNIQTSECRDACDQAYRVCGNLCFSR